MILNKLQFKLIKPALFFILGITIALSALSQGYIIKGYNMPVFDSFDSAKIVEVRFNIYDGANRVTDFRFGSISLTKVFEGNTPRKQIQQPIYINQSFKYYSGQSPTGSSSNSGQGKSLDASDILVSILVDKSGSMTNQRIDAVNNALRTLLNSLPEGSVYLSEFANDVYPSKLISGTNFKGIGYVEDKWASTALINATYMKLQEFDSTASIINENQNLEPYYNRNTDLAYSKAKQKYLIVITDGQNDVGSISKYHNDPTFTIVSEKQLSDLVTRYTQGMKMKIITIFIEEGGTIADPGFLKRLCTINNNLEGFLPGSTDSIGAKFQQAYEQMTYNYSIKLQFTQEAFFSGKQYSLLLNLVNDNGRNAEGTIDFTYGSEITSPVDFITIFKAGVVGVLFILLTFIIIHLFIPIISNKWFSVKYVTTKYVPPPNITSIACEWCGRPVYPVPAGEKAKPVVIKCKHPTHLECWKEFGDKCAFYPRDCKEGKHEFFDVDDPFAKKNTRNYLNWVVYGMIAGLLAWLFFSVLNDLNLFNGLITWMVDAFRGQQEFEDNDKYRSMQMTFIDRISPKLLIASLLGFFIPAMLLLKENKGRFTGKKMMILLARGCVGALTGFVVFLIGGLIVIVTNSQSRAIFPDIIPWMLFGPLIGLQLAFRTSVMVRDGLIGGIISILLSFLLIYLIDTKDKTYWVLISQMIYGGGLGLAVSTAQKLSTKHIFRVINNVKNDIEIPIHKWLMVYPNLKIGSAKPCEIILDWDKSPEISQVHIVMKYDEVRKSPVITSESDFKTYINNRVIEKSKPYRIYNGDTLKLGNTVFQYMQLDQD